MLIPTLLASVLALATDGLSVPLLVPKPVSLTQTAGAFVLDEKAVIGTDTASRPAAALLSSWLKATTGRETKITGRGTISLKVNPALTKLGSEGCQD